MPLQTREYDLEAEADRLTDEMEAFAERQASEPLGSDAAQQAAAGGQRAERFRSGVLWAVEEFDADTLAYAALTNGERHRVRDTVEATEWKQSDCYVAA